MQVLFVPFFRSNAVARFNQALARTNGVWLHRWARTSIPPPPSAPHAVSLRLRGLEYNTGSSVSINVDVFAADDCGVTYPG